MKRQTRQMLLNIATGVALAMTAAVVFTPAAVMAAEATATANANVRSAPSTSGRIIGTLRRGDVVDVDCGAGWCELDQGGYVSASLLSVSGSSGRPNVGVGVTIGNGGISIGIGTPGRPGPRPGPGPIVIGDDSEVCFFDRTRYRGASFCLNEGESISNLQRSGWNDRISSFRNEDDLRVTVCYDAGYSDCRTYRSSASTLGDFDDEISSIRVR